MTLENIHYKDLFEIVPYDFECYLASKIVTDLNLCVQPNFYRLTTGQLEAIKPITDHTLYNRLWMTNTPWPKLAKKLYMYVKAYNCFWPTDPIWPKSIDYVPAWGNQVCFWKQVKLKLDAVIKPLCLGIVPLDDLYNEDFEMDRHIPF